MRQLLRNNSKNVRVQTEKALWNDAAQDASYNYLSEGRNRSETKSHDGAEEYIGISDDSDVKEQRRKKRLDKKMMIRKKHLGIDLREGNSIPPEKEAELAAKKLNKG
mmetsp:Transcript_34621/g.52956  ORF Transcript_34621/g.52956 Transcript_34621/m.52956 type:complete len:107 (+) Transcript_34621:1374-1694(+)